MLDDKGERLLSLSSRFSSAPNDAYAALSTVGPYEMTYRYYRPIPEFIAGFSVTTALPHSVG